MEHGAGGRGHREATKEAAARLPQAAQAQTAQPQTQLPVHCSLQGQDSLLLAIDHADLEFFFRIPAQLFCPNPEKLDTHTHETRLTFSLRKTYTHTSKAKFLMSSETPQVLRKPISGLG